MILCRFVGFNHCKSTKMAIFKVFGGSSSNDKDKARNKDKAKKSAPKFKMSDEEIVKGILDNDEKTWAYIYMSMKPYFYSALTRTLSRYKGYIGQNELDEIFVDSAAVLMDRVKDGKYKLDKGSLFTYFVMIGWGKAMNLFRSRAVKVKKEIIGPDGKITVDSTWMPRHKDLPDSGNPGEPHDDQESGDIETEQNAQEKLLEEMFKSLPERCQKIYKLFYWDKMPMDEIAPLVGSKNADVVKTQKSNCMKKAKDILSSMDPELIETALGRSAERAMLASFIRDEMEKERSADTGSIAAYAFGNKDIYIYDSKDLDAPLPDFEDQVE